MQALHDTNTTSCCWPGHHSWFYKCIACSVSAKTFPLCVDEWNTETLTIAILQALLMGLEVGVRSTSTLGYIHECSCAQHRQQRRSPRLPQLLHRLFLKKPMQGLMSRWVGCSELSAAYGACSRPFVPPHLTCIYLHEQLCQCHPLCERLANCRLQC